MSTNWGSGVSLAATAPALHMTKPVQKSHPYHPPIARLKINSASEPQFTHVLNNVVQ